MVNQGLSTVDSLNLRDSGSLRDRNSTDRVNFRTALNFSTFNPGGQKPLPPALQMLRARQKPSLSLSRSYEAFNGMLALEKEN